MTNATHRDAKEATAAGLKVGDIVKFREIIDVGDSEWRARIIELRGQNVLVDLSVMPQFSDWRLAPSQSVRVCEVIAA